MGGVDAGRQPRRDDKPFRIGHQIVGEVGRKKVNPFGSMREDRVDRLASVTVVDAKLEGEHVALRPIEPADYLRIRRAETGSSLAFRWRHAGANVPPEQVAESLFSGVLATFLYTPRRAGAPGLGLVSAYGADPRHGFCYFAAGTLEPFSSRFSTSAAAVESTRLFLDFVFQGWNFRKIHLECADFNTGQFGSFLDRLDHEGTLKEHIFLSGQWWDFHTFTIWRDQWQSLRELGLRRQESQDSPHSP